MLVFGCGYLGIRVAQRAVCAGHVVWATTRRPSRACELAARGLNPVVADWNDSRTLADLPAVDQVLVAVSHDRRGRFGRWESQVGGMRRLLAALPPTTSICYISTTGVYHQTGGQWVDECSPTRPNRAGGQAHLAAEQLLHRYRPDSNWTILRLAGIYGPGRVPRAADVIAGHPIRSPERGYLNLIHVEDAVTAVETCWAGTPRRLYAVADDQPMRRGDFYREIAKQCRAPDPRFAPPAADAPVTARSESDKRVWNRRMKRDLVPRLRFPTYREGLRDVLSELGPDDSRSPT